MRQTVAKEFQLKILLKAIDKATGPIGKVAGQLDKIGKATAAVGKRLTTGVTLPVVGIGIAATKVFADFEQGMSEVGTLIDTDKESLEAMGDAVRKIGKHTPVALSDLTSALYDVRSAGVDASNQFEVLEGSARLAVSGKGTTAQAVDLVTSSLNAFGLKGADAAKVYDNIFRTVKNGKTTIAGLSQGFGAVAGTVGATGTKLDEYLASVAALTTTGLPAAQAHSQLRAVISGLTRDTKETSAVFHALGSKNLPDLIKKSGGLVPALQRVSKSLGGNNAKILKLVGSTEGLNAVIGLTGKQNKTYLDTLKGMRDGSDAVNEAFEKQNKTAKARMQRLKNAATSAGIAFGKILVPALEKVTEVLQDVSNWFDGLDRSTKETIVTIAGIAAVVGPVLLIGGKFIGVLAGIARAVGIVSTAIKVVGIALATNPIGLAIMAIAGLAALLIDDWEPVGDVFRAIFGVLVKAVEGWIIIIKKAIAAAKKVRDLVTGGPLSEREQKAFDVAKGRGANIFQAASIARNAPEFVLGPRAAGESKTVESKAEVKIKIEGAPRGTRASVEPGSTANVGLDVGYQLGGAVGGL
jgi:TP901 family phage tail tape measure protein